MSAQACYFARARVAGSSALGSVARRAPLVAALAVAPHVPRHNSMRAPPLRSTANPDGPGPVVASSAEEVEKIWEQLTLAKRQLNVAISQESFAQAAQLRDKVKELSACLPPVQQFLYGQLERLRSGSIQERREAIAALGAAGNDACLPELALCLRDPALREPAHAAMWAVFGRWPDPRVGELMAEAEPLLHAGNEPQLLQALGIYEQVVQLAPSFAEGFNKRATVLYLLHRYPEAISDCETVLQLNPYHFGAASGMGLCHWSLKQTASAVAAFEAALEIHPGLGVIKRHLETLREELEAKQQQKSQQQDRRREETGDS